MVEGEAGGVEELALEAEEARGAVVGVAADGVADGLHVDADLVGAAALQTETEEASCQRRCARG